MDYAKEKGVSDTDPIFEDTSGYRFIKAYKMLGKMLKVNADFLTEKNITYYSGRHFWKTVMNVGQLGEGAEEVFMGHKVSADVARLYNHRDMQGKQGRQIIVKKAKHVFKILDTYLF